MNSRHATVASMRVTLGLCYAGMMCLAIAVCLAPIYLTTWGKTFGGETGLTKEELGRIPGVTIGCLTAGILLSGWLADRWGAKLFVLLGLAFGCGGLVVMASAQSYAMLLVAGGLAGLGAGVLDMVLSPIVSALCPDRRSSAMNWLHSFFCIGAVGTALVGFVALHFEVPWRTVVLSMAGFPAIILVGFLWARVPPLVEEGGRAEPIGKLLRSPFFIAALAAIFLGGATEQGMAQWLSKFAQDEKGQSESFGSLLLAGFLLGMAGGRVIAAMVAERVGPYRLMMMAAGLAVVLYAVGSFSTSAPVALGACVMIGFAGSCLWPTLLAVTANQYPRGGATMFAMLGASGNTGCSTMPWLIGIVADHSRISTGLAFAGLYPLALLGVLLWMVRHARSRRMGTAPAVE